MMYAITEDQFIGATRAVLAERGDDFVYDRPDGDTCVYSADGGATGSCLFGAVLLEKLGVPYSPEWEEKSIPKVLRMVGINLSGQTRDAASIAQDNQDDGRPYEYVAKSFNGVLSND